MSRIVAGQQAKLTAQNCFSELRKHLTRATVTHCYAFKKEEQARDQGELDEDDEEGGEAGMRRMMRHI